MFSAVGRLIATLLLGVFVPRHVEGFAGAGGGLAEVVQDPGDVLGGELIMAWLQKGWKMGAQSDRGSDMKGERVVFVEGETIRAARGWTTLRHKYGDTWGLEVRGLYQVWTRRRISGSSAFVLSTRQNLQ